jgi:uncharacterized membrane-anchored protein YhcB (DUF1043 family)
MIWQLNNTELILIGLIIGGSVGFVFGRIWEMKVKCRVIYL